MGYRCVCVVCVGKCSIPEFFLVFFSYVATELSALASDACTVRGSFCGSAATVVLM